MVEVVTMVALDFSPRDRSCPGALATPIPSPPSPLLLDAELVFLDLVSFLWAGASFYHKGSPQLPRVLNRHVLGYSAAVGTWRGSRNRLLRVHCGLPGEEPRATSFAYQCGGCGTAPPSRVDPREPSGTHPRTHWLSPRAYCYRLR